MARPKSGDAREKVIAIRTNEGEHAMLMAAAVDAGSPVGVWVREAALHMARIPTTEKVRQAQRRPSSLKPRSADTLPAAASPTRDRSLARTEVTPRFKEPKK